MKFFYNLLKLTIITCLLSCSEDNNQESPVVDLSSTKTFIGDTLTLTGTNLNQIGNITVYNENLDEIFGDKAKKISQTETEIKFIVPVLFDEKATIYFGSSIDPVDVELYGFIPYEYEFNGTMFRDARINQILNNDVIYFSHDDWGKRFKLTDNYSNLENLQSNGDVDERYYYRDENSGYILSGNEIYSFNDNINNRNLEYSISISDLNDNSYIRDIQFISNSSANIMNGDGEMFQVLDGTVTPFQDLYPELSNTPYMSEVYQQATSDFKVLKDGSIIIMPWHQNYILKLKNGEVNMIDFESRISFYNGYAMSIFEPTFFDNMGGFYSKSENKIYKTNDYGQTWTSNEINFPSDENVAIEYLGGNQFIAHRYYGVPTNMYLKTKHISLDNGNSWRSIYHSARTGYVGKITMFDEYGFTVSKSYGLVKFRRFPENF